MINKTSCRPIQSVIILVINKSDSRCAVVRFCYHSYDYRPNWTPLSPITITNHKNYNFLACDWFKKVLFSTNSLAKSLSDSLLLDSLLLDSSKSQSHSKM